MFYNVYVLKIRTQKVNKGGMIMEFTFEIEYGGETYEWNYDIKKDKFKAFVKTDDGCKDAVNDFLYENPDYTKEEVYDDPSVLEDDENFCEYVKECFYDDAYEDFIDNKGYKDGDADIGKYYDRYERL